MAGIEHVLETRIRLRYGTYNQWMNSSLILQQGEAAICAFPRDQVIDGLSNTSPTNTPPAIGIKIGDGQSYFYQLPWIQAIAADVYNWAKTSSKPTYTAQEIQGLQSYIENMIGGDVNVTIAPRIYQLISGTNENQYKYYLRYKENTEDGEWVIDTSSYIDLEDLHKVTEWLGRTSDGERNIDVYPSLIIRNAEQINYYLNKLTVDDNEVNNKFVTAVSQTAGVINITRAQPNFSNISGYATVQQGGTGRATLTQDYVLVGNGTDPVQLIPIAQEIANNNHLVPNYLIKNYVDSLTQGITGAMHFIGEATVVINNDSTVNPNISGYSFASAQPGDVILYEHKEFVWTGGSWRLLGDEGSYVIKGSIKDIDVSADAAIQQSKIAGLTESLLSKVDKVADKQLSTNDYTTEDKNKLASIEDDAQKNIIEHFFINGVEQTPSLVNGQQKSISLTIQSFDEDMAQKLEGIEAHANVNKIEHIFVNEVEQAPSTIKGQTKSVNIQFNEFTSAEKTKLNNIEENAEVNTINYITVNGVTYYPDTNKNVNVSITATGLGIDLNNITAAKVGHKLTFGSSGIYVYDGSTDIIVPVYTGGIIY